MDQPKEIIWIGNSRKCIAQLPVEVKRKFGHTLYFAQMGEHHHHTKIIKGLGSGTYEIFTDHRDGTFRAVYTVKYHKKIYVLHVFQKKSKIGIKTPAEDIDLIQKRLKVVKEIENDEK